jgi:hypothetical protein
MSNNLFSAYVLYRQRVGSLEVSIILFVKFRYKMEAVDNRVYQLFRPHTELTVQLIF